MIEGKGKLAGKCLIILISIYLGGKKKRKPGHHDLWWQLATHHLWSGGPSKISWNPAEFTMVNPPLQTGWLKLLHSFLSEFLCFLHSWSFDSGDSGFPPSSQTTVSSNSFFLDTPYPALIPVIFRLVQRGFTFSHFFSSIDPSLSISADLEMLREKFVLDSSWFILIRDGRNNK